MIVQHGVGECAELLRLSHRRHTCYALLHNATLIQDYGRRCPERGPHWEKIPLLLEVMGKAEEKELIVWLDADVLIQRMNAPLDVLKDADFGLTRVKYPHHPQFFNTGMMLVRNHRLARMVLEDAFQRFPNSVPEWEHPKHDEKALNASFEALGVPIQELPAEYNSWHKNAVENPIIQAWHGMPETTVRTRMAECLRQRPS